MTERESETTSIEGNWPLNHYAWKTEQKKLVDRFLAGVKEKKMLGVKCPGCGLVYCPPKAICRCLNRPSEWVEVSDAGEVTAFTLTGAWSLEGKPKGEGESLIVVGFKLDGADTMMVAILQGAEPEDVDVGMRVRIKWSDDPKGVLEDIRQVEPE